MSTLGNRTAATGRAVRAGALALALTACRGLVGQEIDITFEEGGPPPLHPTALTTTYEGSVYPIVSVDRGQSGRIEKAGKLVRIDGDSKYQAVRAKAYLPGSIAVRGDTASSNITTGVLYFSNGGQVSMGTLSEKSTFKATIVPTRDYADCYLALVFFDAAFLKGDTDAPGFTLSFEKIGDVKAGVPSKVDTSFAYINFAAKRLAYVPLFFSHGVEIRSNFSDSVARVFRRVEAIQHERILEAYRQKHPKDTVKAAPYLRFPFIFADGHDPLKMPPTLRVEFTVTEDGTVEDVAKNGEIPMAEWEVIQRTIRGWLFLPQLVNGLPRRTFIAMDLQFEKTPPAK